MYANSHCPVYVEPCVFLSQVSSALLSDLRTALQDLFCELWEQHRAAQFVVRQFANAKAAWAVECTELKSLISKVRTRRSESINEPVAWFSCHHIFLHSQPLGTSENDT